MSKLRLDMTGMDICIAMGMGNPGALRVLSGLVEMIHAEKMGAFNLLLALDAEEIYGPKIWMLYMDICGGDWDVMLKTTRQDIVNYKKEGRL